MLALENDRRKRSSWAKVEIETERLQAQSFFAYSVFSDVMVHVVASMAIALHIEPEEKFIAAFVKPPLYSTAFDFGFGTLYTAAYRPRDRSLELHWPGALCR